MQDKVVVITGGSSGIGRALAQEFGSNGSKILITGRRDKPLMEAATELRSQGIEVSTMVADVSRETDNQQMAQLAIEQYGGIDILINNAGISMRALFKDVDLEVIRKVMDINFYGSIFATKYCLPSIIERQGFGGRDFIYCRVPGPSWPGGIFSIQVCLAGIPGVTAN